MFFSSRMHSRKVKRVHIKQKNEHNDNNGGSVLDLKRVYGWLVIFRCVDSWCVQTHFNPDEYWQSLEIAHKMVFGYGHLTWEWTEAIRGYLHPFLFAILYKALSILQLDTPWLMIHGPRFFQAFFVALGDVYVYKLTEKWFGHSAAKWALVCQVMSWFNFYSLVRTYSNSLEAILTVIALYYWPFPSFNPNRDQKKRAIGLLLGMISFVLRPTSAITWAFLGIYHIVHLPSPSSTAAFLFKVATPIALVVLGLATVVDRLWYGRWVLVPLEFVKFNVLAGVGDFYGTHPWHWYISQGFPTIGFTMLPVGLVGMFMSGPQQRGLAYVMAWLIAVYSLLGHKEFRFIHATLLLLHVYSGFALSRLYSIVPTVSVRRWKVVAILLLLLNIPMAAYFCLWHQRAPIDVMWYINTELAEKAKVPGRVDVDFICGCHSTPFHAYVHNPNISMHFLDCTPNWRDPNYKDEVQVFNNDPVRFVEERYKGRQRREETHHPYDASSLLPSHVVMFSDDGGQLDPLLTSLSYKECKRFSHIPFVSWIVVYCLR